MQDINEKKENITKHQHDRPYDSSVGTTIEYTALARDIEAMYKEQEIIWPELNEEWKGYKYTAIVNTDTVSTCTMDIG